MKYGADSKEVILTILTALVKVVFIHPEDAEILDLSYFDEFVWFLLDPHIEKGQTHVVLNDSLKRTLIEVCLAHPERVKKGTKGE